MAISVVVEKYSNGAAQTTDVYERGEVFVLRDGGHLVIVESTRQNAKILGLYAPGQWSSVYSDSERQEVSA